MANGIIDVASPMGDAVAAQSVHDAIVARERELRAEFDSVAAKLTPESFTETKDDWTRLKKIDGELKSVIERVEAEALAFAKADAVLFQLRSTRKILKSVYEANWAKFVELRDAGKPEEPKHTYVMRILCTDSALGKVLKAAQKEGCEDIVTASAQSDKAVKAICKWFNENV